MTQSPKDFISLSVRRPLLAIVLNLLIVIAGVASLFSLEVREFPNISLPFIQVEATFDGAAPGTMDAEVTSLLEDAISRVPGVKKIEAESEEAESRIGVEFYAGTNMDAAAADVREAVNQIQSELPTGVKDLSVVKEDPAAEPVLTLAITSENFDDLILGERVHNDIVPVLNAINGVSSIEETGVRTRELHVALNPLQLSRYNLTVGEIVTALTEAPYDIPVGSYASRDQDLLVRAEATAVTPDLVEGITIRDDIRIGDVAQAYFAPTYAVNYVRLNGQPAIGLGVRLQTDANVLEISKQVHSKLADLREQHSDLTFTVTLDQAVFIDSATREVLSSLAVTCLVVALSILIFFGRLRATLIPSLAIPTALIGSLIGFWALGYTLNLITLLALVLATGLTVDDAIVVFENIQRRRRLGEDRQTAAIAGSRQVFFAVIATTLVLIAVFVPISLLPSTLGLLFREFGFILAIAVAISSLIALTLVPALAAHFGSVGQKQSHSLLITLGGKFQSGYVAIVQRLLRRPLLVVLISLLLAGAAYSQLPSLSGELVPEEDRGLIQVWAGGPDGVGIDYMRGQADQIEAVFLPYIEQGVVQSVYSIVGRHEPNKVFTTVTLVPWAERTLTHKELLAEVSGPLKQIIGSRVRVFGPEGFEMPGSATGAGFEVALTGASYAEIHDAGLALSAELLERSDLFEEVELSYSPTRPQLSLQVDRQSAADLGVSLDDLGDTLSVLVGGLEIVDLNVEDQAVPIILSAPTGLIQDPENLRDVLITTSKGQKVPLSSLTTLSQSGVAAELERVSQRRAIILEAETSDAPLSAVTSAFKEIANASLPAGVGYVLMGASDALEETNRDIALTYGLAVVIVFLVLVAQFNNLVSPLIILAVLPFGLATTVVTLLTTGVTLNIFSQIGVVLLIGLVAKNSILLVEFADQEKNLGKAPRDAIIEAARTRLRPIAMTVLSTMIGALPLIFASGAGAEARAAIGWTIFAGLGFSSLLTLFLTPALYLVIAGTVDRLRHRPRANTQDMIERPEA
ncbi:efflux RND transporter permease subunit [Rhodovibrionaceae bacterium A322]